MFKLNQSRLATLGVALMNCSDSSLLAVLRVSTRAFSVLLLLLVVVVVVEELRVVILVVVVVVVVEVTTGVVVVVMLEKSMVDTAGSMGSLFKACKTGTGSLESQTSSLRPTLDR